MFSGRAHAKSVSVLSVKKRARRLRVCVPVMARRVGMTGWSSGSVFDLNGARARTGTRARNHKNDRESKGTQAGLRNLFNMSMLSEQGSQLQTG
jgi:hypothetical protein